MAAQASLPAGENSREERRYFAEVLPPDHTVITDPLTGVTLTFLTTNTPSSSLYFHDRSWLADGSMILIQGERGLTGYLTATGERIVLSSEYGNVGKPTAAAVRSSIFCMRGDEVLELTPFMEISPNPEKNPSKVIIAERVITTIPSGGQLNVNYDDSYLSFGTSTGISVIDVASGKVRQVCATDDSVPYRGHVQWSHTRSNLLSFASGTDWHNEGDQHRLWIVDPGDGALRNPYQQIEGELVTHESWWVNDQILFCGAPPPVGLSGDPERRQMANVNLLDPATGVVRIMGAGSWWPEGSNEEVWKRNWWHCAGSDDGRWVVADTFHGDIVLFEGATTRPHLLTSGHRTFDTGQHPEPGWDRKSEQIIFSSHMLRSDVNACVATIPEDLQRANPSPH